MVAPQDITLGEPPRSYSLQTILKNALRTKRGRIAALSIGTLAGCSALLYATNASRAHKHPVETYTSTAGGLARFLRSAVVAGRVAVDYWWVRRSDGEMDTAHRRNAERVRKLCVNNGGAYVKMGQHVSQLEYLLPPEYCQVLRSLCRNCPVTSFADVEKVMEEEFGSGWKDDLIEFNEVPVASASLAQVHVGKIKDGTKVAVKVQHRGLREASRGDIQTVKFFLGALKWAFKEFDYEWLGDEIETNLPQELDFKREARNCRRTSENFKSWKNVSTPDIFWELTSPRVLTMSFEEGVDVCDPEKIAAMNLDPSAVAKLISETLSAMVFFFGFIHSDLHYANVLVRPSSKNLRKPEIVLLDHGLYTDLGVSFRDDYASLWYGIITGDSARVEKAAGKLGCGEFYKLLSAMLTLRPWEEIEKAGDEANLDRLKVRRETSNVPNYITQHWRAISEVLRRVPRQMLLVLKANDTSRSVDALLGAGGSSLAAIPLACARQVARKVRRDAAEKPFIDRLIAWLHAWAIVLNMYIRLLYLRILRAVIAIMQSRQYEKPKIEATTS
eukprot:Plantae.Rhodophyta-Hildenbrandia_rubra.ctg1584.p1 GENE.Plantae.Rhodophyta-Hildenbrandia_rubra.ctg1584~~Plantae.Rhodophyta-Hildenbrandia_rubra.ctg1584.p1  ORF type:complete len:558 (+),score=88.13 Plantae.Rhodophyta-Hildenbrandia_rubra.ctg1584:3475-5148(+)